MNMDGCSTVMDASRWRERAETGAKNMNKENEEHATTSGAAGQRWKMSEKWAIREVGGGEEKIKNNKESRDKCFEQNQIRTAFFERWPSTLDKYPVRSF